MSEAVGWARPWAIAKPFSVPASPRAGAWYRVLGRSEDGRLVLEIRGRRMAVLPHLVEFRERRPTRFTLVVRPRNTPIPGHSNGDVGRIYAVCPSCNARVPLYGEPPTITCGTCHHRGEVAYWETG